MVEKETNRIKIDTFYEHMDEAFSLLHTAIKMKEEDDKEPGDPD